MAIPGTGTSAAKRITPAIDALCESIVPGGKPAFIPKSPAKHAISTECFASVAQQVETHGGSICYGWRIWEWPRVMIEAECHAVWRDPNGNLVDISPLSEGTSVLFLADPQLVYEDKQVDNVRRPLQESTAVNAFIAAAERKFEIMNRGARAEAHGQITLKGEEAAEFHRLQMAMAVALLELQAGPPSAGRNEKCPCGSDRKYKKCCGA